MSSSDLKKGFTTGAAASAAVKAALITCFSKSVPETVTICFLTGEERSVPVYSVKKIKENQFQAIIIKDAGDDPDVTHKAQIGARVTVLPSKTGQKVTISGGQGVGVITKPGLELAVGEPAINPGPRTMIKNAVELVLNQFNYLNLKVDVEVFVPKGEELAKKTLNERLGILGGISILGTTGIVTPMSHDAYIATIKSGIDVAAANGSNKLVFTTGRRSERFAMNRFKGFPVDCFIQTGDFFKASLDMVCRVPEIDTVIYTVFFGKAVKMAMGFEHTHAAKSELTLKELSKWAFFITNKKTLAHQILKANTARHAFDYIYPHYPALISYIGQKIVENASLFSNGKLTIRTIIFDFEGTIVYDSKRRHKDN